MFQTDQQNLVDQASATPVPTVGTTPGEAFSAALDATERYKGYYGAAVSQADFIQQKLDAYEARTGEKLSSPGLQSPANPLSNFVYNNRIQALRDTFAAKAKELNDPSIAFPSDQEIQDGGNALTRQSMSRQEQLGQGQQDFGAGVAGWAGGQVTTLPSTALAIATIPEGGLGAKMLGAAAGFGGTGLLQDLQTYGHQKEVNPAFGPGDVIKDVAAQAITGAGFELGGKFVGDAAGAIWRRFKNVAPAIADKVPMDLQDAGNVAERVSDIFAQNPFSGADGAAAHAEAVGSIDTALTAGRAPELPASAMDPTIAGVGPTADEIAAHARATNPVLFDLADKADSQVAAVRAELNAKLADPNFRMLEANIPVENELRGRLNELQMQRAAMGPEINAARQGAETFLDNHPPSIEAPRASAEPPQAALAAPTDPAAAFGDKATVDAAAAHPYKGINRIADAMKDAAPEWSAMRDAAKRGDIPGTFDVSAHITSAVKALVAAKDAGRTIEDVMNNGPEFHSDTSQIATKLFFRPDSAQFLSKSQMTENLKALANGLRESPKPDVAAAPPLDAATARLLNDATAPEAVSKFAADPKMHEAMEANLNRNVEQGRNRVPIDDGNGGVTLGFADKELHTINAELDAAKEIGACAAPVAEVVT